jgi:hypothetical protein
MTQISALCISNNNLLKRRRMDMQNISFISLWTRERGAIKIIHIGLTVFVLLHFSQTTKGEQMYKHACTKAYYRIVRHVLYFTNRIYEP